MTDPVFAKKTKSLIRSEKKHPTHKLSFNAKIVGDAEQEHLPTEARLSMIECCYHIDGVTVVCYV